MIITYHGKQFFKLQQGDFTLAYNPLSKESSLDIKPARFGANITLVSARHPHYNGVENTQFGDTTPFVAQGPGSYEVAGVTINGFETKAVIEKEVYVNTLYFVVIDGVSYCFVGDINDPALDQQIKEYTDSVDVLFLPIGGGETIDPLQAAKLSKVFGPKAIIPMDYGTDRDKGSLQTFLKEMGSHADPLEKYVFKSSDLDKLSGEVIVLSVQ